MNGNNYYIITSFIPCNTDSYYSVITITVYQKCHKFLHELQYLVLIPSTVDLCKKLSYFTLLDVNVFL
jgi:hypothetical protein